MKLIKTANKMITTSCADTHKVQDSLLVGEKQERYHGVSEEVDLLHNQLDIMVKQQEFIEVVKELECEFKDTNKDDWWQFLQRVVK